MNRSHEALPTSTVLHTGAHDPELEKQREAVRSYGGNYPIILESIQNINEQLAKLQFSSVSEETTQVLVRQLAVAQLMVRCEKLYRLIYGSQIAALHLLNSTGPQPEAILTPIFEAARNREPKFYGEYNFSNWIGFLKREGAVCMVEESNNHSITVFGGNFLEYLGFLSLPAKPH